MTIPPAVAEAIDNRSAKDSESAWIQHRRRTVKNTASMTKPLSLTEIHTAAKKRSLWHEGLEQESLKMEALSKRRRFQAQQWGQLLPEEKLTDDDFAEREWNLAIDHLS